MSINKIFVKTRNNLGSQGAEGRALESRKTYGGKDRGPFFLTNRTGSSSGWLCSSQDCSPPILPYPVETTLSTASGKVSEGNLGVVGVS